MPCQPRSSRSFCFQPTLDAASAPMASRPWGPRDFFFLGHHRPAEGPRRGAWRAARGGQLAVRPIPACRSAALFSPAVPELLLSSPRAASAPGVPSWDPSFSSSGRISPLRQVPAGALGALRAADSCAVWRIPACRSAALYQPRSSRASASAHLRAAERPMDVPSWGPQFLFLGTISPLRQVPAGALGALRAADGFRPAEPGLPLRRSLQPRSSRSFCFSSPSMRPARLPPHAASARRPADLHHPSRG